MVAKDLNTVFDKSTRDKTEIFERGSENIKKKAEAIKQYRKEASRMASLANKRVKRLEEAKLTDTPAYKAYLETGGKFSVKGKTYNELQQEVSRLKAFIDAKTSTIKGATEVLKEMASNTGITYNNLKELREKAPKFFELSSKVEQYLRTVKDMASAIGYQKIWEAVNKYTKDAKIDLSSGKADLDSMVASISAALAEYEQPAQIVSGWYSLKKSNPDKLDEI